MSRAGKLMLLMVLSTIIAGMIVVLAGLVPGAGPAKTDPAHWSRPVIVLFVAEIAVVAAFLNDASLRLGVRFLGGPPFFAEVPLGYAPEGALPAPGSRLKLNEKLFFIYPAATMVLAAMIALA